MALAYDAADRYVLGYGGTDGGGGGGPGETWTFANGSWTQRTLATSPGGPGGSSGGQSMVYDPVDHQVIQLTGNYSNGSTRMTTYAYHAGTWSMVSTPGAPPIRWRESFTWDSADGYALLFGGCADTGCSVNRNDTWSYVGGVWTNRTGPVGPPPLYRATMASDPSDGEVILFGGDVIGVGDSGATWAYAGGSWHPLLPGSHPTARDGSGMATLGGAAVLFGGEGYLASNVFDDTWRFAGGDWSNITNLSASSPPAMCCTMMSYNGQNDSILQFGGYGSFSAPTNETWQLQVPFTASWNASPDPTDEGIPVHFRASATGGVAPYFFNWTIAGVHASGANVSANFSVSGTYPVVLFANDSSSDQTMTAGSIVVKLRLGNMTINTSSLPIDGNSLTTFSIHPSGGSSPYRVNWSFGDGSPAQAGGVSIDHRFPGAGTYNVSAAVTDNAGAVTGAQRSVPVSPGVSVDLAATSGNITLGQKVSVTVHPSGGAPPYGIAWTTLPAGCTALTGTTANCTPPNAGNATFAVNVTDRFGSYAPAALTVHVLPRLGASVTTGVVSATTICGTYEVTFTAEVSGGHAPDTYLWAPGSGAQVASPNLTAATLTARFSTPGRTTVLLTVTDADDASTSATGTVTVPTAACPVGPGTGSTSPDLTAYLLVAVIAVLVAALAVFLLRRSGRPPGPPPGVSVSASTRPTIDDATSDPDGDAGTAYDPGRYR